MLYRAEITEPTRLFQQLKENVKKKDIPSLRCILPCVRDIINAPNSKQVSFNNGASNVDPAGTCFQFRPEHDNSEWIHTSLRPSNQLQEYSQIRSLNLQSIPFKFIIYYHPIKTDNLENIGIGGRILKWILKKWFRRHGLDLSGSE